MLAKYDNAISGNCNARKTNKNQQKKKRQQQKIHASRIASFMTLWLSYWSQSLENSDKYAKIQQKNIITVSSVSFQLANLLIGTPHW